MKESFGGSALGSILVILLVFFVFQHLFSRRGNTGPARKARIRKKDSEIEEIFASGRSPTWRELGIDLDEMPSMPEGPPCVDASVSGEPTFSYAVSHEHDLKMMIECCNAELRAYKETGQVPAPFYFERVAILARKQGKYSLEVKVCEQYIRIIEKMKSLPPGHPRKPLLVVDHMADRFKQRLPKAKELLKRKIAARPTEDEWDIELKREMAVKDFQKKGR